MKILIVEDERELSDSIVEYMSHEEYLCEQAFDYVGALRKVSDFCYDCILLDLMLPGGSGLDILREIKKQNTAVGVIIISAKGNVDDKVLGLKIGADDYLAKPFHLSELSMRVYALIRRQNFTSSNLLQSNGVDIDLLSKEAVVNGKVLDLTKTEFELLLFLVENRRRVVSKSAVAEHLSGDLADAMVDYNFIYAHIKNLKAKLAAAGCSNCIKTIYGTGYKWME